MMFRSVRKQTPITGPELDAVLALMHKPRTSGDVSASLRISKDSAGQRFAILERMGKVRKAEMRHGYQIWERAE